MRDFRNPLFLAIFLIALISWKYYFENYKNIIVSPGGIEQADIAENIIKKKGFVSNIIMPYKIALIDSPEEKSLLYSSKDGIFQPLIIALFFTLFGISSKTLILTTGVFYLGMLLLVYKLAKNLFNSTVAIISCLIFLFDFTLLKWSIFGSPEIIFYFFFLTAIYTLFARKNLILCGFFLGICFLSRPHSILYLPLFLFFLGNKIKGILKLCIPFILTSIPFFYINYLYTENISGTPLGNYLAFGTSLYPGHNSLRITEIINPLEFLRFHKKEIFFKIINSFSEFLQFFPYITNIYLMAIWLTSVISGYNLKEKNYFRLFIYFLIMVNLAIHSLTTGYRDRYFYQFLPLIFILTSDFLIYLFKTANLNIKTKIFSGLIFVFLLVIPYISETYNLSKNKKELKNKEITYKEIGEFIKNNTEEDEIFVSDIPWFISWYGGRKSFILPLNFKELEKMNKKIEISGILLSSFYVYYLHYDSPSEFVGKYIDPKKETIWTEVLEGKIKIPGYKFIKEKCVGEFKILLFKRRDDIKYGYTFN